MAVGWIGIRGNHQDPAVEGFALNALASTTGIFSRWRALSARAIHQLARDGRLGDAFVSDKSFSLHAHRRHAPRLYLDLNTELIAGQHGSPEPGALNAGEDH